jgi:uracil-DNA glycosylase
MDLQTRIFGDGDVVSAWFEACPRPGLRERVRDCLTSIYEKYGAAVTPAPENVLRALKVVRPQDVQVLLLGQDPYYTAGTATGLCFDTGGQRNNPSVRNIVAAIRASGLAVNPACERGDLSAWARSAHALMLNTVPVTLVGRPLALVDEWDATITEDLMRTALEQSPNCHVFLWGNHAKSYARLCAGHRNVYQYAHPAARPPNEFAKCPNFREAVANGMDPNMFA